MYFESRWNFALSSQHNADDVSLLDGEAVVIPERLTLISSAAELQGGVVVASQNSFAKHLRAHERLGKTMETDVQEMNFGHKCDACERSSPYKSSLTTNKTPHCGPAELISEPKPSLYALLLDSSWLSANRMIKVVTTVLHPMVHWVPIQLTKVCAENNEYSIFTAIMKIGSDTCIRKF